MFPVFDSISGTAGARMFKIYSQAGHIKS